MKATDLLLLGGIGIAAYFIWNTINVGQSLQFVPLGVSINGINIAVNVGVQNPTSSSLTLLSFAGVLAFNGTAIANVSNFSNTIVGANSQTQLSFNVTPNWIGIGSDLISQLQNDFEGGTVTLKGTANVNGHSVPVNVTF